MIKNRCKLIFSESLCACFCEIPGEYAIIMEEVMFRLWAKEFKENRLVKDITITDTSKEKNRTKKVFDALDEVCYEFDLSRPIWLDRNINEFKRIDKTRFYQDNFIDSIEFDFLEISVIEEDEIFM